MRIFIAINQIAYQHSGSMTNKVKGILLHSTLFQEADLSLQLLTESMGIISVVAKNARKSKKRFGGGILEPGNFVQLEIQKDKWVLEAQLLDGFEGIRTDYERLEIALGLLKILSTWNVHSGELEGSALFYLLGHALRALSLTSNNPFKIQSQFWAKFLFEQGMWNHEQEPLMRWVLRSRFGDPWPEGVSPQDQKRVSEQLRAQLNSYFL